MNKRRPRVEGGKPARRARRGEGSPTRRIPYPELRATDLDAIESSLRGCRACRLNRTRRNPVPVDNPSPVPIALVGEAPGASEDKEGKPFVGRSGKLLDSMLARVGAERAEVAVLNTVACRPPNNRDPKPDETEACRPNFDMQLDFTGAWIVVLLGSKALHQFRPGLKISEARGTPFWMQGRIYVPAYHPAYILRNRKNDTLLENDLRLAFQIYRGEKWWPPLPSIFTGSDNEHKKLTYQLEQQGWAAVHSERLMDEIVVLKDDLQTPAKQYATLPRYTMEELIRMGELGRGTKLTLGELSSIHLVKRMGGTVVQ